MEVLFRLAMAFGEPVAWLLMFMAAVFGAFAVLAIIAGLRAMFTSKAASRKAAMDILFALLDVFRRPK